MTLDISFHDNLPDPAGYQKLLVEYYTIMIDKLQAVGGPFIDPKEMAAETMAHIDDLLPPNGRLLLAIDEAGEIVGCGNIRKIREDAAELKRMYVRPTAQGSGLGRKLFELRLEEAKRMGCTTVYADTTKGNRAMLAMYEKLGFSYVERYPENANPDHLSPFLVYLKYEIPSLS